MDQRTSATFRFQLKTPFLGKFGPKYQNYQLRVKFGTPTNSNMQNLMVMLVVCIAATQRTFFCIYPFQPSKHIKKRYQCVFLSYHT